MKFIWKLLKRTLLLALLAGTIFLVNLIWFKPFFIGHFYNKIFIEFALKNPQMITSMGYKFFYDELNDNSQQANDEQLELLKKDYEVLHNYNRDQLKGQELLSYDILDWFLQGQMDGIKYNDYGYSQTQKHGQYMGIINFMTNMHKIDDVGDAKDYL
ncbi:MAG TPA: DUF885 family protein, partial [Gammaproteobacteria bacterium]|nr:DUF885 family protein [Gammaproteobacteria bacterium]